MMNLLASGASANAAPDWVGFLPIIGMVAIFWFLIIRPQMRQQKAHREKISALSKGDKVITAGGLVGKVTKVDDEYAEVEIAQGIKVKAVKSTISDTIAPGGTAAAND